MTLPPETLDGTLRRFQINRQDRQLSETHNITATQQGSLSLNLGSSGENTETEIAKLLFITFIRIQHEGRVQLRDLFQELPQTINDLANNCHRYEIRPRLEGSNKEHNRTIPTSYNVAQPIQNFLQSIFQNETLDEALQDALFTLRSNFAMIFESEDKTEECSDWSLDSYVRFRQGNIKVGSNKKVNDEKYESERKITPKDYRGEAARTVKKGKKTGQPTRIIITSGTNGKTLETIQLKEDEESNYYGMGSVFPRLVSEVNSKGELSNVRPPENMKTLAHHNLPIEREVLDSGVVLEVVQSFEQANEPHLIIQARDEDDNLKTIDALSEEEVQAAIEKAEGIAKRLSPEGYIVAVQAGGTFNSLHVHIIPCPEGNTIPPVTTPRKEIGIQIAA